MPALTRILTPDGRLHAPEYAAESLKEAAQYEPDDGVYTTFNTLNTTQTIRLQAHFDRLEDSALRENIPLKLDRALLRRSLRRMIEEFGQGDVRARVTVARQNPDELILTVEPYRKPDQALIEHGVKVVTASDAARSNPAAKTTDWMFQRAKLEDRLTNGVYDVFLLDQQGNVLEGLGSNAYGILDGQLHTAEDDVLKGIARQIVLDVAPQIVPVALSPFHVQDIPRLSDAFLTSSSRGIIPVVEIDGIQINGGSVGELTRQLYDAYWRQVSDELEEL